MSSTPAEGREVPWLDDDELADWLAISGVLLVLPAVLDAQLQRDAGVSLFSYLVMARLSEVPERTLQMSQLAAITHGSLSKLSHAVTSLERHGWVRRRPSGEGRATVATLTDAGHEKLVRTAPGHVATVREVVLDPLAPQQRRALADAAALVLGALGAAGALRVADRPSSGG
ncbi:MAG: Transcriptional regulator, MarR family [uncultured Quadrisphaera sp.]|uniref:Transcriptional regulator, MarR family n=1 Tax=uncultured Quadrisphaera sp. TaxID=904978 RepID=A0A6J4PVZ0_9ACTN|nr:MAG: Transcriptional regulator, MarR family [uncultured Quadrisphaera sp.]